MTTLRLALTALLLCSGFSLAQTPQLPTSQPLPALETVKEGRQLLNQGKLDQAIELFKKAMIEAPDLYEVHSALGAALDLEGNYPEARQQLQRAIEVADSTQKSGALRAMAVSYAFERNSKDAAKYGWQAYQTLLDAKKPVDAAGALTELARIELESGDIDAAEKTYKTGCAVGAKAATTPADQDLWGFRTEHALARIAARRGKKEEARKHVIAAKAILDKGTNSNQAVFFPYLTGYVAFYGGDYKTALGELQKADQKDPFILALIAQTYEKMNDKVQAKEYWTKVMGIYSHNPTNAFARPLAKKALGV